MPVGSSRRKPPPDALLAPTALSAALRFPGGPPHVIHAYLHEGAVRRVGVAWALGWLRRTQPIPVGFDFQGSLVAEMLDHRFVSADFSPFLSAWQHLERWTNSSRRRFWPAPAMSTCLLVQRFGVPTVRVNTLADSVDPQLFRPRAEFPISGLARRAETVGPAVRPAHRGLSWPVGPIPRHRSVAPSLGAAQPLQTAALWPHHGLSKRRALSRKWPRSSDWTSHDLLHRRGGL